ncbi:hypothetical protein UFOVP1109_1, partial [uncultured Caudovirales phage]
MKTKMTLAELQTMERMAYNISFAKSMKRGDAKDIEKELLECINEWLRGDDEKTR